MTAKVTFDLRGFYRQTKAVTERIERQADEGLREAGMALLRIVRSPGFTPVLSGFLRSQWRLFIDRVKLPDSMISNFVSYGIHVDRGTQYITAQMFTLRALLATARHLCRSWGRIR